MTSVDFDPVLAAELQALVPLDEHAHSDWRDVERRTGHPRTSRRLLVAAAVLVATLLLVVPALAALTNWVDFSHAPTASPPVVKRFADLSREAPSGLDPRAIATETRRLEIDYAEGTPATLFIAPSEDGGYCLELAELGGPGCNSRNTPVALGFSARDLVGGPAAIYGAVLDPDAATVSMATANGQTKTTLLTRVGPPINASFFVVEVDDAAEALPIRVEVRDRDGAAIATRTVPRRPSP
jgi:hypothetical protein